MINASRCPVPVAFPPRVTRVQAAAGASSLTKRCEKCGLLFWPVNGTQKRCRTCRIGWAPPAPKVKAEKPEYTKAKRRKGDSDTDVHTTAPVALPKANAAEAESPAPVIVPAPAISHQPLPSERRKPMVVSAKRERAERDARLAAIRAAATARQRRFLGI